MAQQTQAVWTQAQNATELSAGDDVRVVDDSGSAVLDTATVRDSLGTTGTVNLTLTNGRTKEVRFQDDGRVKVRGDCFTYTLEVRQEVATDGGQDVLAAERSLVEEQAEQPQTDGGQESEEESEDEEGTEVAVAYHTQRAGALRVETGTTHYSWDIPGFGKSNDPHSGSTAKRGGKCAYLEVRGQRSDEDEKRLALLAQQYDLEVSASGHRATLVPPSGW